MGGPGRLSRVKVAGMSLGGRQIRMGPVDDIQLLYILLDRALIFYSHIINWAHGRRDHDGTRTAPAHGSKAGVTARWDESARRTGLRFFKNIRSGDEMKAEKVRSEMNRVLMAALERMGQQ
jgi:predicted enzyme related to lactoylglutathione lyase